MGLQKKVTTQKKKLEKQPENMHTLSKLKGQFENNKAGTTWLWLWVMCVFSKVMHGKKNQIKLDDDDQIPFIDRKDSSFLLDSENEDGFDKPSLDVNSFFKINNEQMHKTFIEEASQHFLEIEKKAFSLSKENNKLKESLNKDKQS